MSRTIDDKIVEMQFDNRHFEKNVETSMKTLDELNEKVDLLASSKGLDNLAKSADNVDMSGLSEGVEQVSLKFNALHVIADQVLRNIVNSAMSAGKRIISALTVDPIKTGLSEYETQIGAIQTIMANTESKGSTLEDVNNALGELNTYADKTIYNFTEMTRNIGTFTAAGVDLDTSVNAIKGIANLAAVSGSTSQQASVAMYQLSQALSSGTVKLMDWNSVVNAGMGGQVFQDALKETARVQGVAIDDLIKKHGSFRETLQEGWLTSEVLLETLNKFTMSTEGLTDAEIKANREKLKSKGYTDDQIDAIFKLGNTATSAATKVKTATQLWDTLQETAQSGWTQTWEIIVGDFEEAKELFSNVYNALAPMIEAMSEARNEMLENWKVMGGRNDLLEAIKNAFYGIKSIIAPIKEGFRDIFPPYTAERLVALTEGLKNFTAKLKLSDAVATDLRRIFKGVFAVLSIVIEAISAVFKAVGTLLGGVGGLGASILHVVAYFMDWVSRIQEAIKATDIFNRVLQSIALIIRSVFGGFKKLAETLKSSLISPILEKLSGLFDRIKGGMSGISESAAAMKDGVTSAVDSMDKAFEGSIAASIFEGLSKILSTVGNVIVKVIGAIGNVLGKLFNGSGGLSGFADFINGLVTGGLAVGITKLLFTLSDLFGDVGELGENFVEVVGGLGDCLDAFANKLNAEALKKIAVAIAILAAAIVVLSMIDEEKMSTAIGAITMLFTELLGSMAIFNRIGGAKFGGVFKTCGAMIGISLAVLILASALKKIGELDFKEMAVGLYGVTGLLALVFGFMKLMGNGGNTAIKGATQMILFAAAVKILASACADLAWLSLGELGKGLIGVGVLMAEIVMFMQNVRMNAQSIQTAIGIVILAGAIKILASACEDFSQMTGGGIYKGLTAIGVLLVEIAAFAEMTKNANKVISIGVAMIAIAAAMKIFASAAQDMAGLTWGELAKGLVGMAGALATITLAVKYMPKNMIGQSLALVAIAGALVILSSALNKMGGMSWEGVAKGLVALGGSLLIISVGLHAMKGTLGGTAALMAATAALAVLAPVMGLFGTMKWGTIAKGLIAMAAAFVIIGVAGHALAGVTPIILKLAASLALIGVAMLAAGVGVAAFGAGISAVAAALVFLVTSLGTICSGLVNIIAAVVKGIIVGIGEAIIALLQMFSELFPAISDIVVALVELLCDVLGDCLPTLVRTVLELIVNILDALIDFAPQIVSAVFKFLIGIIDSIGENLPELIKAVLRLISSLFTGVIEALRGMDFSSLMEGIAGVGLMAALVVALSAIVPFIPGAMVGALGVAAVVAELAIVLAAIGALAQIPGLEWLINEGGDFLLAIGTAIGKFVGGIAGGIASGVTSALPKIGSDLSAFMASVQPFIAGARLIDSTVLDGVKSLAGVIMALTAANIFDSLSSWLTGGSSLTKFGEELATFGPHMRAYADAVSGIDTSAVSASANAAKALSEMADNLPKSGGIASWFAGNNDMSTFAEQLTPFGEAMKAYSAAVAGLDADSVVESAKAAKALAEMTSTIPNTGGLAAWFAGENSVSKFAWDIEELGQGLSGFAEATAGIVPENIVAAAKAAKALAEMTDYIPNSGGLVAWFTGDNCIAKFGTNIVMLGVGLKGFAMATSGIVPETIIAAANAAKALAEMTNVIPNSGGVVSWFAGDNSISKFAGELALLGVGLKGFSMATTGIVPESITAAANAAKALAEMTSYIPNSGGVAAWFTGEASMSKFGSDIVMLGVGLKGFAMATTGIDSAAVTAAANAAKALAEMTSYIPNSDGVVSWFTGEASISKFAGELTLLGVGLKGFAMATSGIVPETVTAAANAAKTLAEMTSYIPNTGGVTSWFAGEASVSKFAGELVMLGLGLKGFSNSVVDIKAENVTAAANAAKALAEMTNVIPKEGGIKAWFTGESNIATFADKLPDLGSGLKGFSDSVAGISPENVTAAANAGKSLAEMANSAPKNSGNVVAFGTNLSKFGEKLSAYFSNTSGITADMIANSSSAIDAIKKVSEVNADNIKSVASALRDLTKAVADMTKNMKTDLKAVGKEAIDSYVNALKDGVSSVESACRELASACVDAIKEKSSSFESAGKYLVTGFANGISANSYKAAAKARAMAKAAAQAAEDELDINSPSKVFRAIGTSIPEGFAMGIDKLGGTVTAASSAMGEKAISGVKNSITRIADVINGDIDAQPTIRPVLDLSDVKSGAGLINGLFEGGASVGVLANVGAIGSMMDRRNQNGGIDDMLMAIDKLRRDLTGVEHVTYNINGITYDDGSNIADAVKALVNAAKVERRA